MAQSGEPERGIRVLVVDDHPLFRAGIRERLEACGVEFVFEARVTDFVLAQSGNTRRLTGVRLADGRELGGDAVVLATGHSARDIYRLLERVGVEQWFLDPPGDQPLRGRHSDRPLARDAGRSLLCGRQKLLWRKHSVGQTDPQGFIGVDGAFRFMPNGLTERMLEVQEIQSGKFVTISPAPTQFVK